MSRRTAPSPSGGRPRNPEIDRAVLRAVLSELDDVGYPHLTIEAVARRAGTTRPAVYRRWPTRQVLVLAALAQRLDEAEAPDTGCTLCDLGECLLLFVAAFERMPAGVLAALLADCAGSDELRGAFMTSLFDPPRAAVGATLDKALARGDLRRDVDRDLILDLLGSLVYYRSVFGHAPTSETEIEGAVRTLLRGAATDYPGLVEHSRRANDKRSSTHHATVEATHR